MKKLMKNTSMLLLAIMLVLPMSVAMAAPQTLTILGAQGNPGEIDPYTEFSLDNGETWSQAYLYGWHPWGFVPGTNSWINCGPSGFECLNQKVLYRVRFNVPEDFSNPQMRFDVKADNAATIWLNGTYVTHIVGGGGTTSDATINSALQSGMNEIRLLVDDWGGWAGFNYKITLNVDAPTAPTLQPAGEPSDSIRPVTTIALSGMEGEYGWYLSDATFTLNATDNESETVTTEYRINGGEWAAYTGEVTLTDGMYTIEYRSTDAAGNVEEAKSITINVDTTAPESAVTLDKDTLWSPNHKMVAINAVLQTNDETSGIAAVELVSIESSEPDSVNKGDKANDIQFAEYGTNDTAFMLRAERLGNGEGRIYTITYKVIDAAGNATTDVAYVKVPHDQGKK